MPEKVVSAHIYRMAGNDLAVTQSLANEINRMSRAAVCTDHAIAAAFLVPDAVVTRVLDRIQCAEHTVIKQTPESDDGNIPECFFKKPSELVNAVMVDEVARHGRYYVFLFKDAETGELLFYANGHGKAAAQKFCDWGGDISTLSYA